MGLVKKSITVTEQQEGWIKEQIASGHFGNESEVVRSLIRREQTRDAEIDAIRLALAKGEKSGMSQRTPKQIKQAVLDRKQKNGKVPANKRSRR